VAGDVLHDRDGALADERERLRVGADALACGAAGGVETGEAHGGTSLKRALGSRLRRVPERPFVVPDTETEGVELKGPPAALRDSPLHRDLI
jgi:hypothetical protein